MPSRGHLLRRRAPDDPAAPRRGPGGWKIARWLGAACLFVAVVGVAWLVVTGLLARSQLNHVKAELPQLRQSLVAGQYDQARQISDDLGTHARRAHALTTGPAWWTVANLPGLGTPLQTSRVIAAQTDLLSNQALPGVLQLTQTLNDSTLRRGASINLQPIASAEPLLTQASVAAQHAATTIGAAQPSWLSPVASARSSVLGDLNQLSGELTGAARTVKTILPMLGQNGVQRYFIGFENEAEARGLGGLPGAFAIATADHGTVTFTHFENDTTLDKVHTNLNLGADFQARYSIDDPANAYVNSDISPHFPDAARIWAAMWEKYSGEHVDGAIAIDPTALSYLLQVTGPATLPGGSQVSASNVVALTQQTEYAMFPSDAQRRPYLVQLAKAVSEHLLGTGQTTDLLKAAAKAAGERRLVVWSSQPAVEADITAAGYGGVVTGSARPFTGFVVVNAAGTKLDYYLDRTMTYQRTGCGTGSTSLATFTLTNNAPRSGLPAYVTGRSDSAAADAKPGDNRLLVSYYGSSGARVTKVTMDGKSVPFSPVLENGLVTVTLDVELPVGTSRTITVSLDEPAAGGPVQVLNQPLVRPMTVNLTGSACP